MRYPTRTFIVIATLISIVLFLGGFRLGKQVERLDKSYVPPITITPTIAPSIIPTQTAIQFKTLSHSPCAMSFIYPDNLKIEKNSSTGATLKNDTSLIQFDCIRSQSSTSSAKFIPDPTITTVNNKKFSIYSGPIYNELKITNPLTGRVLFFTVSKSLTDLIIRTLEFKRTLTP